MVEKVIIDNDITEITDELWKSLDENITEVNIYINSSINMSGVIPSKINANIINKSEEDIEINIDEYLGIEGNLNIDKGVIINIKNKGYLSVGANKDGNTLLGMNGILNVNDGGILIVKKNAVLVIGGMSEQGILTDGILNINDKGNIRIEKYAGISISGTININHGGCAVLVDSEGEDGAWIESIGYLNIKNGGNLKIGKNASLSIESMDNGSDIIKGKLNLEEKGVLRLYRELSIDDSIDMVLNGKVIVVNDSEENVVDDIEVIEEDIKFSEEDVNIDDEREIEECEDIDSDEIDDTIDNTIIRDEGMYVEDEEVELNEEKDEEVIEEYYEEFDEVEIYRPEDKQEQLDEVEMDKAEQIEEYDDCIEVRNNEENNDIETVELDISESIEEVSNDNEAMRINEEQRGKQSGVLNLFYWTPYTKEVFTPGGRFLGYMVDSVTCEVECVNCKKIFYASKQRCRCIYK